jgi:hypothetical protein
MSNVVHKVAVRKLLATWTSRKMDWLTALAADIRLKPVDKLIGFVILQHVNRSTLKAWPSQETIHMKSGGVSVPQVKRSIKRLCETGWLERQRRLGKGKDGWAANVYVAHFENLRATNSFTCLALPTYSEGVPSMKVLMDHRRSQLDSDFDPSWDDDDYSDLPHFAAAFRKAGAA